MSDYRGEFLETVERSVLFLQPADHEKVVATITKILSNYEITGRCTDVAVIDPTNERILKRYTACLRIDGRSETTIKRYYYVLMRFSEFINKPFTDVGVYEIRYYLACEKDRGIANASLEGTRSTLSAFFTWMINEELIIKNPMRKIKPVKCRQEVKLPYSDVEIDALRSACRTLKERALVEMLLASGVRVSELVSMEVTDIDFTDLSVRVRHGKGDKERITYITDVCALHLRKYLLARTEQGTALFYNKNHKPIAKDGIQFILKEIGKRAGVENVHPHRFRRTFASSLAERGMDIQEIQILMGHTNIDTTLIYVHTNDQKVKTSYKRYA